MGNNKIKCHTSLTKSNTPKNITMTFTSTDMLCYPRISTRRFQEIDYLMRWNGEVLASHRAEGGNIMKSTSQNLSSYFLEEHSIPIPRQAFHPLTSKRRKEIWSSNGNPWARVKIRTEHRRAVEVFTYFKNV